jgi:hypothetical protein
VWEAASREPVAQRGVVPPERRVVFGQRHHHSVDVVGPLSARSRIAPAGSRGPIDRRRYASARAATVLFAGMSSSATALLHALSSSTTTAPRDSMAVQVDAVRGRAGEEHARPPAEGDSRTPRRPDSPARAISRGTCQNTEQ